MALTKLSIIPGVNDAPDTSDNLGQNGAVIIDVINQIIDALPQQYIPMLQVSETHIQWKLATDTAWVNLVSLESLKGIDGNDGTSPMFQVGSGHIQWKLSSDTAWNSLISVGTLRGDNGSSPMLQTTETHIQWKLATDTDWINLIPLPSDGIDGSQIELRVTSSHIQWKLLSDTAWVNLVSLSTLTGITPYSEYSDGTYTFGLDDIGIFKGFTVACNATIPVNIFPVGCQIIVSQEGTGTVTITPEQGVTANGATTALTTQSQFRGTVILYQKALNVWRVYGGLT